MKTENNGLLLVNLSLIRFTKKTFIEEGKSENKDKPVEHSIILAAEQLLTVAEQHMLCQFCSDGYTQIIAEERLHDYNNEILSDSDLHAKYVAAGFKLYNRTLAIAENFDLIKAIVDFSKEIETSK